VFKIDRSEDKESFSTAFLKDTINQYDECALEYDIAILKTLRPNPIVRDMIRKNVIFSESLISNNVFTTRKPTHSHTLRNIFQGLDPEIHRNLFRRISQSNQRKSGFNYKIDIIIKNTINDVNRH
jgi:hypothetical protein